jgi:hypothetical protein
LCLNCRGSGETQDVIDGLLCCNDCSRCQSSGKLPGPEIDPQWLSSTVRDLVKVIRGGKPCGRCNECIGGLEGKCCHVYPPHYDRTPILADALLDSGCDCEELLIHLRSETHLPYCWALAATSKSFGSTSAS